MMFKNYIKISFRNLWKHKGYSAINLTGLAIGMACFILISLWVQNEFSYDKFHKNADRIYRLIKLDPKNPSQGICRTGAPWGPALKKDFPEIENFVRFRFFGRTLVTVGDKRFFETGGLHADSTIFDVFSFTMINGDPNTALDDPNSIVLTESMAEKYFGDENPVGRSMNFDNSVERKITGVMQDVPENSHMPFDFLLPFSNYRRWDLTAWGVNNFHLYLLLDPNADPERVETKLPDFVSRYISAENAGEAIIKLQPLTDIHLHSNLAREFEANGDINNVYMFSAIAVFILIIACINFMNLTTARSANRAKEVGIRKVVGSQRKQLIVQFFGESILLCTLSLFIALGLIEFALPFLSDLFGKTLEFNLVANLWLGVGLVGVVLIVGILSGAYPALYLSAFRPIAVIKGKLGAGSGGSTFRKILVILQFAISIALIVGTAVVYRQLNFISEKKLGFQQEQVVVIRMNNSAVQNKYETYKNELLKNSNILKVSATSNLLGGSDWGMPFYVQTDKGEERFDSRVLIVDHDFVETLDMEIVAGRDFSTEFETDWDEAILINETAAGMLGFEEPVGKVLRRSQGQDEEGNVIWKNSRIVGILKDFHFRSLHEEIQPMVMYIVPEWFAYFHVRIRPDEIAGTLKFMEEKWQELEPARPFDYFFLDAIFDQMYRAESRFGQIFTSFALLAIFVACLGLFGLASFMAEQRTKEIGIRKVLGASTPNIILNLSKDFTVWVLLANIIAWPLAFYAMSKWLENFAYRVDVGVAAFLLAAGITLLIAMVTVSYQSIKAALTNPVDALRYE